MNRHYRSVVGVLLLCLCCVCISKLETPPVYVREPLIVPKKKKTKLALAVVEVEVDDD